jgi:hypothetical protein
LRLAVNHVLDSAIPVTTDSMAKKKSSSPSDAT